MTNKTALVTGGNRGIGFAICQGLLKAGFDVLVAARSADNGKDAVEKLLKEKLLEHGSVTLVELDISSDSSIKAAVEQVKQKTNTLDVLVNNAGVYPDEGVDILTVSRELLAQAMNTNTFSPIELTQAFMPLLEKSESPRVVNMSSGNGQLEGISANAPSYSLSKMALH